MPAVDGMSSDVWQDWLNLNARAATLLRQLKLGLDYYGKPDNWTPIVSLNEYHQVIAAVLPIANQIEISYKGYQQDQKQERQFQIATSNHKQYVQGKVVYIRGLPACQRRRVCWCHESNIRARTNAF